MGWAPDPGGRRALFGVWLLSFATVRSSGTQHAIPGPHESRQAECRWQHNGTQSSHSLGPAQVLACPCEQLSVFPYAQFVHSRALTRQGFRRPAAVVLVQASVASRLLQARERGSMGPTLKERTGSMLPSQSRVASSCVSMRTSQPASTRRIYCGAAVRPSRGE